MTIGQKFKAEFAQECMGTRRMLAVVPMDKADYRPHPKSMKLGSLAVHVAEIATWAEITVNRDVLDFANFDYKPFEPKDTADLLAFFDKNVIEAEKVFENAPDAQYTEDWTMRSGEQIYFTMPKEMVVRTWCLNHLYHHRAQLSVYLRMLDIPVPGMYGPTADDAK